MPDQLARFIARFDRGEFWLAHEELEPLWLADRDDFLRGLIQVAAALVHAERGNRAGAVRKLDEALGRLAGLAAGHRGCDVESLRARVAELRDEVERADESRLVAVARATALRLVDVFPDADPDYRVEDVEVPERVSRYREGFRIGRDPLRRD